MIRNQVNKFLNTKKFVHLLSRYVHNSAGTQQTNLHPLLKRTLLQISGDEVSVFLQGLITNDMNHFEEGAKSIYAMFLNNKGRVLFDTLIHKAVTKETFLVECDKDASGPLQKHLKMFRLRKKININDISKDLKLWALTVPSGSSLDISQENFNIYKDPRLSDLGYRVIAPTLLAGKNLAETVGKNVMVQENDDDYKYLRYKLGVSEGVDELSPGSSFPLEVNCDYLHGVSFHKGCYIGQELTARVHHTGVVRKRIMPLKFTENIDDKLEIDAVISERGNIKSNLGKLKGYRKDCGLGLLRVKEATEAELLTIGKYTGKAVKPKWWPVEAPKEKLKVSKVD